MNWLIYGANGYSGALIAREAQARGLRPILAGRSQSIHALAAELGLEARCFPLDDRLALSEGLRDVQLVLHCAGPFSATAAPMVSACLQQRSHYLDITGEVAVFEQIYARHAEAQSCGVLLCPGVGFDVVPTDCLALALLARMPDASHLRLGFDSRSGVSPGTAKTSLEALSAGGLVRESGVLRRVPLGWKSREIDFGDGPKRAITIPWGDLASAWRSTAIPNIETYVPVSPRLAGRLRTLNWMRPLFGLPWLQNWIKAWITARVQGPPSEVRRRQVTWVWGEVENARGERCSARVRTANGYSVTVSAALGITEALIGGKHLTAGAFTPAQLMGAHFVERLPGSTPMQFADTVIS